MTTIKKYVKIILNAVYFPFLVGGAVKKLATLRKEATTMDKAITLADEFYYGPSWRGLNINIKPGQIREEITGLLEVMKKEGPKVILEIGTASGGTMFLFSQFAREDATIISIDLPFGKFGAGYLSTKATLMKTFARGQQTIELLSADSHSPETMKRLLQILDGRKVDFMFIDGDHTLEGVRQDFAEYKGLVKSGGVIGFHDIAPNAADPTIGVPTFWRENKDAYEHQEFNQHAHIPGFGYGIGVLRMP